MFLEPLTYTCIRPSLLVVLLWFSTMFSISNGRVVASRGVLDNDLPLAACQSGHLTTDPGNIIVRNTH